MYKLIVLAATASAIEVSQESTYRPTAEQAPWYKTASSSTWNVPDWKINYKVPNFGVDHDIKATQKHEKDTSKKLGAWNPKKDKDDKWIVPTEDAFFRI